MDKYHSRYRKMQVYSHPCSKESVFIQHISSHLNHLKHFMGYKHSHPQKVDYLTAQPWSLIQMTNLKTFEVPPTDLNHQHSNTGNSHPRPISKWHISKNVTTFEYIWSPLIYPSMVTNSFLHLSLKVCLPGLNRYTHSDEKNKTLISVCWKHINLLSFHNNLQAISLSCFFFFFFCKPQL